eukprot:jgi/Chrzof1/12197/Cz06g24230.t1
MDPLSSVCFKGEKGPRPSYFKTGIPPVDAFHCLLTPFFLDTLKVPFGRFVTAGTLGTAIGALGIAAIESIRLSSRFFVKSWFLTALLSQLLGISVVYPLAWLPSYFLATKSRVPAARLPASKVSGVFIAFLLTSATMVLLIKVNDFDRPIQDIIVVAFNLGLPLSAIIWTIVPARGPQGHQWAITMFYVLAVLTAAYHWYSVVDVVQNSSWEEVKGVALRTQVKYMPAHFLLVDMSVLFLATCMFISGESGFGWVITVLGLTVLVGPGAAILHYGARRESQLARGQPAHQD